MEPQTPTKIEPKNDAAIADKPVTALKLGTIFLGPLLCLLIACSPVPEGLTPEAWKLVALTAWMMVWWMTEAAPLALTALLPIPMMPLMGINAQKAVTASYGHPLINL